MFTLPKLNYDYAALEPHIDRKTMDVHYNKHHKGYTNKLNNAIEGTRWEGRSIEDILANVSNASQAIRNNGGGFYNHSLFWSTLSPQGGGNAEGEIGQAIESTFGSFDNFKRSFSKAATSRFGSGWAWLSLSDEGQLFISSTPNQDNPLMDVVEKRGTPLMGLDVWEHAYYLHYQNRRADYVDAFFNLIDWKAVNKRFQEAKRMATTNA
jgi:Fe-Mn family superoxide dismutase